MEEWHVPDEQTLAHREPQGTQASRLARGQRTLSMEVWGRQPRRRDCGGQAGDPILLFGKKFTMK